MENLTLTPAEISDIIDRAFALGKIYAADEINSTGMEVPCLNNVSMDAWGAWIEKRGGHTLNAGDAKLDILWEAMAMKLKDDLKQYIDY